jgi:hypothetical protein
MHALPHAGGSLSDALIEALRRHPESVAPRAVAADSPLDAALSLWLLYELSYGGFAGVDPRAEWEPSLIEVRRGLEDDLEERLRLRMPTPPASPVGVDEYAEAFFAYVADHDGVSLARHVRTKADAEQVRELLRLRSLYHLKEADPTAWAVPRLPMPVKAALAELQYDEYGAGRPTRLHARIFADGMAACGLEARPHVEDATIEVLEQNNAMSLFGLHGRLRGAAVGHLAAFEATSSLPSRQMAQGLARLGFPEQLVDYYEEHVEADAVHEQLAVRDMCARLAVLEPEVADDIWFGAFTCLDLEDRFGQSMLDRWGIEVAA